MVVIWLLISITSSLAKLLHSRRRSASDLVRRDLLRAVKTSISTTVRRFSGYQQHVSKTMQQQQWLWSPRFESNIQDTSSYTNETKYCLFSQASSTYNPMRVTIDRGTFWQILTWKKWLPLAICIVLEALKMFCGNYPSLPQIPLCDYRENTKIYLFWNKP